jgi:hypothetical protein
MAYGSGNITQSGYYTVTVKAGVWYGSVLPAMALAFDNQILGHGIDLVSGATNVWTVQLSAPGCTSAVCLPLSYSTTDLYLYAGTHTVQMRCLNCGGSAGLFVSEIDFVETSIAAPPREPAGSRDPTIQPFRSYQILNTAIGSGAVWSGATDADTLAITSAANAHVNSEGFSYPIYHASVSDPLIYVRNFYNGIPTLPAAY